MSNNFHFISVIVPVYNDSYGIDITLRSLINQQYPHNDYEIIVADNGSTDNTLDVVRKYQHENPELIKLVIEDSIQSSYAARNKGVYESRGSIIAFIDADMSVDPDWLTKINKSLNEKNADYLACNVEIYSENNTISALYNKLNGFPVDEYIYNRHFAPTCCLVIKRTILDDVGMFDSALISSGDYEFGNRVYNSGYHLHYDPEIIMYHPARDSFKKLIKKSFRIGRGFYQLSYYYPEIGKKMNKNMASSISSSGSWNFFTFKKGQEWNNLSSIQKTKLYLIDLTKKSIKPIGYVYEKFKVKK